MYDWRTGNLVDRFVTMANGIGASKALPLGRYTVTEVQAPQYYKINENLTTVYGTGLSTAGASSIDITLEFATQIVKLNVTNASANTGVSIKKTGNIEAMPTDIIRYDIPQLRNDSTVPLTDFYWRDMIPTDALRLSQIVTGTYNHSLRYKIMVTTNKGNSMVIADNLSTLQNNVIDCRNAAIGLPSDEYVTSFTLLFGVVPAGFTTVEQPQIYTQVLSSLPSGYQFANKVDIGGKYQDEWVISNSTWLTTIYRPTIPTLPQTGY